MEPYTASFVAALDDEMVGVLWSFAFTYQTQRLSRVSTNFKDMRSTRCTHRQDLGVVVVCLSPVVLSLGWHFRVVVGFLPVRDLQRSIDRQGVDNVHLIAGYQLEFAVIWWRALYLFGQLFRILKPGAAKKDVMFIHSSNLVDLSLPISIDIISWLYENAIADRMSLVSYCANHGQQESSSSLGFKTYNFLYLVMLNHFSIGLIV